MYESLVAIREVWGEPRLPGRLESAGGAQQRSSPIPSPFSCCRLSSALNGIQPRTIKALHVQTVPSSHAQRQPERAKVVFDSPRFSLVDVPLRCPPRHPPSSTGSEQPWTTATAPSNASRCRTRRSWSAQLPSTGMGQWASPVARGTGGRGGWRAGVCAYLVSLNLCSPHERHLQEGRWRGELSQLGPENPLG